MFFFLIFLLAAKMPLSRDGTVEKMRKKYDPGKVSEMNELPMILLATAFDAMREHLTAENRQIVVSIS